MRSLVRRLQGCLLAGSLLAGLVACGGSSNPVVSTTPTPPPTPPPPVIVAQGQGFPLTSGFTGRVPFTTTSAGQIVATVDWTFASNDVDVLLVRTNCSFDQLEASQCPIVTFSISTTAKPERIQADAQAAGAYTLFVENTGARDESVSFQVVLNPSATGSGAGPAAEAVAEQRGNPFKAPSRGNVELR